MDKIQLRVTIDPVVWEEVKRVFWSDIADEFERYTRKKPKDHEILRRYVRFQAGKTLKRQQRATDGNKPNIVIK